MSLRIIYGRAGCGKSYFCIEDIKKRYIEHPDRTLILIVPEQFTFQAERNLVKALGVSGMGGPEVLSFRRLARRVLDEVGGTAKQHVNQAGKAMIIHSILDKNREYLKAFGRSAGQKGFVNKLSGMISEFKRYNVDPMLLGDIKEKVEDRFLKDKLEDLSLIYLKYEEILHTRYIDTDDDLTLLSDRVEKSLKLKEAEFWIDEFSGFTPQEYEVIGKLLKISYRVNVSLCTDCLADLTQIQDTDVFSPIKYTASRLIKLSGESNAKIENPISLNMDMPWRFIDSQVMHHMEKFFFSFPYEVYRDKTQSIGVLSAANPYSEVEAVAARIINLCRDKKMRYKNIAVITKNIDDYEKLVRIIFPQYDIPFFIDKKRAVTDHPLVLLVLSTILMLHKNFSYESAFRYLKTGLTGIPRQDIDILENYVLANGIRGSQWYSKENWDYRINFSLEGEEAEKAEKELIERINDIRHNIMNPIIELKNKIKESKKAIDFCQYLYEFLCDIDIPNRIEELSQKYEEEGELEIGEQYRQIWDIIMEVLDQTVEVYGDDKLNIEQFFDTLSLGFSEYDMGLIPHAADQVLIGSVDRWRSHEIEALFILGANDGIFPASSKDEGMLSDRDREVLMELGLELAPDTKSGVFEEQYLLYNALTKAGKYLRISYPVGDHEGKGLRPSFIIERLKKIFPNMERHSTVVEQNDNFDMIGPPLPTFNMMIGAMRKLALGSDEASELWKDIYIWFLQREEWKEKLKYASHGLFYTNEEKPLDKDKVKKIYGNVYYSSVSRLERFASCPFSYYVQYGLRAKERKIMRMEAPDIGSFLHLVLSRFSEELGEAGLRWKDLEESWYKEQINIIVEDIVENSSGLPFKRSKRYEYLKERLKKVVNRSISLIIEHVKRSGFEPIGYEVAFGGDGGLPALTLNLPNGEKVILTGRIDRIDLLESDKGNYVRVIDYKSGSKEFRLSDVYNGIQLQLITYLSAIWENGLKSTSEPVLPAGILYSKLDDPVIKTKGKEEDKDIELEIMKEMKMRGLILSDADIIKEMDRTIDGSSLIIPARLNKDGTLGKASAVATMKQFEILKNHVRDILYKISGEMVKGNISISPYKKNKQTSCKFCPYSSICRFEGDGFGNRYRIIKDIKDEEIWDILRKKSGSEGGESIG